MNGHIKNILVCPACRSDLKTEGNAEHVNIFSEGFLHCTHCSTTTPVIHGFPLFSETRLNCGDLDLQWLKEHRQIWFEIEQYDQFQKLKSERQLYDSYAFFQPFNESSRALLALVPAFREILSEGDTILDTWSRTGWMGEWLASLFPEQQIISIWEGDNNVLGYKGFAYWLPESQRRENLSILFTHPNNPFPIATDSVKLTIGLDSLHRYSQNNFLTECRRVTATDGVLFFPHIHLSNSQPEPFFERGCNQLHGKEWHVLLENLYSASAYSGFVFSEETLFNCGNTFIVEDDQNTTHYNGAILIAPKHWTGKQIKTDHNRPVNASDRLILNPLVNIDLTQALVSLAEKTNQTIINELLYRHPIYLDRLNRQLGETLSDLECQIIFHADKAHNCEEIASILSLSLDSVTLTADSLYRREILFPAAVSRSMAVLQGYYGKLK